MSLRKLVVALISLVLLVGAAPSGGAADRGGIDLAPGDVQVRQESGFERGRHPGPVMLTALHSPSACSGAFGFYCDTFRISIDDEGFFATLNLVVESDPGDRLTMFAYSEDGWTARPLNTFDGADMRTQLELTVAGGEQLWLVVLNWNSTPSGPYSLSARLSQTL